MRRGGIAALNTVPSMEIKHYRIVMVFSFPDVPLLLDPGACGSSNNVIDEPN